MTDDNPLLTEYEQAVENFSQQCVLSTELFKYKNRQYGNSIEATGVLGAVVEIIGAVARLPAMVIRNPTFGQNRGTKLVDVLRDIHNYATIALVMIEKDNWSGKT